MREVTRTTDYRIESDNEARADRAYRYALLYSHEVNDDEDIESAITDLIADLAHLAENDYGGGDYALRLGALHFTEEREEDGTER